MQRADIPQASNYNSTATLPPDTEPHSQEQLAAKKMVSDTLIGMACNYNFNFEIKFTEGRIRVNSYSFIGTLIANYQSNHKFQTKLHGNFYNNFEILNFFSMKRDPLHDDSAPYHHLRLFLIKDANGEGWEGTIEGTIEGAIEGAIEGEEFSACDDFTLTSKTGKKTDIFPLFITGAVDMHWLTSKKNIGPIVQLYWLKKAASLSESKIFWLEKKHEELGKTAPENYISALRHYHDAAEKFGDNRAYFALSRMYSLGLGTEVDHNESKKWFELAETAYHSATEVCISAEVIEEFKSRWHKIESRNQGMSSMLNFLAGTNSDIGRIAIRKIEAGRLVSLDRSFSCFATIQRVDMHTDLGEPDYYIVKDSKGHVFAYDNSLNKLASNVTSTIIDSLISEYSYKDKIKVYPIGNDHYEIFKGAGV